MPTLTDYVKYVKLIALKYDSKENFKTSSLLNLG